MAVLYRKYRPQVFSEVLGQEYIIQTLKNQVASGAISHAYLFTGSRGVGKTSVARILAKAVNCLHAKKGEPDGTCAVCAQIAAGTFMDLVEIDAASNTGVENIRDLIEHVKFSPSSGKYKVFIIDEVHMLSKGAFNALLKTLEEPPQHAIFILATTEINKVPVTIISRTQRFDFKAFSVTDLTKLLSSTAAQEKLKVSPEILEAIANNSQGSARDALSLLDKILTLGSNPKLEDCLQLLGITDIALLQKLFQLIVSGALEEIPKFFESLMEKGVDFGIFNKDFLEYARKALITKVTGTDQEGLSDEHREILNLSIQEVSAQDLIFIIRLFLKSFKDLQTSPSQDIPLLLAALEAASHKQVAGAAPAARGAPVEIKSPLVYSSYSSETKLSSLETVSHKAENLSVWGLTQVLEPTVAVKVTQPEFELGEVDVQVTTAEIQIHWPAVVATIKEINSPLGNLVKGSPLQKVEDGRVFLGVKFLFHKQNLENSKNIKVICEAIEKVTGKRLGLCAEVVKEQAVKTATSEESFGDALRIFGGEVVE